MKTLTLLAAILLPGTLCGCDDAPAGKAGPKPTKVAETVEYQLAVANARGMIPEDHPTIAQFKTVLTSLDTKYPEDAKMIGQLSRRSLSELTAANVNDTLLSLMQSVDKAGGSHPDYATAVKAYVAKRKTGGR